MKSGIDISKNSFVLSFNDKKVSFFLRFVKIIIKSHYELIPFSDNFNRANLGIKMQVLSSKKQTNKKKLFG